MSNQSLFTLYRFWHYRELLYVGKTTNPPARLKQHKADKSWWLMVTHQTMQHLPNQAALDKAEAIAILAEEPRFNVAMPVWVIDKNRAKQTAKEVRARWGIPDPEEYIRLSKLHTELSCFELRWGDAGDAIRNQAEALAERFEKFVDDNGRFIGDDGELVDRLAPGQVVRNGANFQDRRRTRRLLQKPFRRR